MWARVSSFIERNPLVFVSVIVPFLLYLYSNVVVYPLLGTSQWYSLNGAINNGVLLTGERLEERAHHANRSDEIRSFRQEILRGSGKSYTVVIGPHGCGKSTLIQDVLQDSAEGGAKGVVYVRHPDDTKKTSLFDTLREAFGGLYLPSEYTFINSFSSHLSSWLSYIDWTPSHTFEDTIILLNEVIETKARDYHKNAGHRFVLIIDEANLILDSETGLKDLHSLQRHMKRAADTKGGIRFILVDSAGVLVSRLRDRSAGSRMHVEEIHDLSRDAAEDLMRRALALSTDTKINISQVYEKVTGGRLILIWEAVEYIRKSHESSIEDVSKHVAEAVGLQGKLRKCFLTSNMVNKCVEWRIVKYLLQYDEAVSLKAFDTEDESSAIDNLLRCDVVFRHANGMHSLYSAIVRSRLLEILHHRDNKEWQWRQGRDTNDDVVVAAKTTASSPERSTEEGVGAGNQNRVAAGKEEL